MSRITRILRTLGNNWKKSTFAFCLVSYGVNYGVDKFRTNEMMRAYCKEAMAYGNVPISRGEPKKITVILNPAAKKKKARAQFEKYCAPLLNLAGMYVSIVQTDNEGQTQGFMQVMNNTDAVAIAGGDGTLFEAVTGLLRRPDSNDVSATLPLGILPLGRTNSVAMSIFGQETHDAKFLAEATMAIIRGSHKAVDVLRIEPMVNDPEDPSKPFFAVADVQWGAYRDTHSQRDKYWYWGSLRSYIAAVFCWPKKELSWDCQAQIDYIAPCSGCRKCQGKYLRPSDEQPVTQGGRRWWHAFIPKTSPSSLHTKVDYSNITNENCGQKLSLSVSTIELNMATKNARPKSEETCKPHVQELQVPAINISFGPSQEELSFSDFVSEMWQREKGEEPNFAGTVAARELWFWPVQKKDSLPGTAEVVEESTQDKEGDKKDVEKWLSIDQENFELLPMHITMLPKSIRLFCPADQTL